ncbi:VanZ family protein [Halogeometricum borinquense]|uniref:Antibiotic resistance protein VanZ n=1 Tax=Halogeometricum borinquense TaxID=60847 RepID=A0A6C0UCW3_9EURY|nr:antibiotic resistance protein VanZ [Halogeometricum borinquense]QIQ77442.1 VanZ family protein [Halogeometricum borinquense]
MHLSRRVRIVSFVCWCALVVIVSAVPVQSGAPVSAGLFGLGLDKVVHFGAYAVTAFLAGVALRARDVRGLALAVVVAVVLGGGVELMQAALPTRTFSLGDAAANIIGAVCGAAAYRLVSRRLDDS